MQPEQILMQDPGMRPLTTTATPTIPFFTAPVADAVSRTLFSLARVSDLASAFGFR